MFILTTLNEVSRNLRSLEIVGGPSAYRTFDYWKAHANPQTRDLRLSVSPQARVALVVPDLTEGGGVRSVARFLARAIQGSQDFRFEFVSLATSASDSASLRLADPRSWIGKPAVEEGSWEGHSFRHVGARFVELEFQRYRPRRVLSDELRHFDLVQIVAGSPAYALVARDFPGPVVLQVATLAAVERRERSRREEGLLRVWRRAMTGITSMLEPAGARLPDRIFVENDWMRQTLESWVGPERVFLEPPGVDTDFFRPRAEGIGLDEEGGYLLSVGRFDDPRKNVGLLFEAFSRLRARTRADVRLVLAGESAPSRADTERARELGLEGAVICRGRVTYQELSKLYREALAVVLASTEEGLGLVLVEAMASGVPVVATRTEGARQVVDEGITGLLVDLGDAEGLARAMQVVVEDARCRRRLGRRARDVAKTHYSHDVAAEKFLNIYRELLQP